MADPADSPIAGVSGADDDGLLTAYLDGQLESGDRALLEKRMLAEPALKLRLDQLGRGGRAFGPAYAALLSAAPEARLQEMLAGLVAKHSASVERRRAPVWRSLPAIAAALVIFVAGGLAGTLLPAFLHQAPQQPGWRQVVAEYQSLTTTETLAAIPDNSTDLNGELATIGAKLALDLSSDKLALPDAALKRAQLFEFRGKPLAQVAYLSPASGPIALCIIANGRPDEKIAYEMREGYNIVFWTDEGRGYMLIGKAPREAMQAYAEELEQRV